MTLRVVCAPDSFKESMSAAVAARCLADGVLRVVPDAECVCLPMADGGEGTTEALIQGLGGVLVPVDCADATGRVQRAAYGWVAQRGLAIIEVAAACGLAQVEASARNPLTATSAGVGTLIRDALDHGALHLIVGLGGSATNDAGAGMITELGARLLDGDGRQLARGGAALADLAEIDLTGLDPRLQGCLVQLACDVDNPLLGPSGASVVFGPQKGAGPTEVAQLDTALARWAEVVERQLGRRVDDLPGSGAAGGLGASFFAFTPARMTPGVELVAEAVGLADQIALADLVLTGEGRVDGQTHHGKTPWGVATLAHGLGTPVIVFGGQVQVTDGPLAKIALALVPIANGPCSLPEALAAGPANLTNATEMVLRLWTRAGTPAWPTDSLTGPSGATTGAGERNKNPAACAGSGVGDVFVGPGSRRVLTDPGR